MDAEEIGLPVTESGLILPAAHQGAGTAEGCSFKRL